MVLAGKPVLVVIGRHFLQLVFLILAVSTVVFLIVHFVPGDPVREMLGYRATGQDIEGVRERLHLNDSFFEQYLDFLGEVVRFRFGYSLYNHEPVIGAILTYFPQTFYLAIIAMLCGVFISFLLVLWLVLSKSRVVQLVVMLISVMGQAIPQFVLGPVLILVFSIGLGWLHVPGGGGWGGLILPALTLGFSMSAVLTNMTRGLVDNEWKERYVLLARAKGLNDREVLFRHILKNVMPVVINMMGMQLGFLLSGTVIVETVFSLPGIGSLLVSSIRRMDFPVVRGLVVFITVIYLVITFSVDVTSCFFGRWGYGRRGDRE